MPSKAKISLNPLPWVLTENGFNQLSVPVLRQAFSEIQTTPFKAIHADPPAGQSAHDYRALLAEFGLVPAPGYFSILFHETPVAEVVEAAKKHAAVQAELGNTEVFIAAALDKPRKKLPAVGADSDDPAVLQRVIDGLGAAAAAITAEGVRPVVHPHVASRIEVEEEVHAVLAGIEDSILGFGPDTGHLTWAGMDAVKIMTQYADRIGAMHLKDVHIDQAEAARAAGASYHESTREGFTVWTEPGRGDIDLVGAIGALPASFAGWIVVEVDVPEAASGLESTQISAAWVEKHLGADAFTANQ
jgi:inosose dehydratase